MRNQDIRFSGAAATVKHHSQRGKVVRNQGNFTRGSQLLGTRWRMFWAAIKLPLTTFVALFITFLSIALALRLAEHELQLDLMRVYASIWGWVGLDPYHMINLTLPGGFVDRLPIGYVPHEPHVVAAWMLTLRILFASFMMAAIVTAPLTLWFVDYSKTLGKDILEEHHERGAMLVTKTVLRDSVQAYNQKQFTADCTALTPPQKSADVRKQSPSERARLGIHTPYVLAGVPYPWRLEQSHTMLIGTTGSGKTTQLRSHVKQLRERRHRAVIFDLTGAFVEAFFNPETDVIMNPMDTRCAPWTLFDECRNYADFVSAAAALIPSHPDDKEPFWQNAARMLFIEMCISLQKSGEGNNAAIAHHLMQADLKAIHKRLEDTVAGPLTTEKAARMAESIRSVLNVNGQAIRFLKDPVPGGPPAFSIRDWVSKDNGDSSIMFITGSYQDLELTRSLFTLWMDLAVNNLMRLPKTRDLRTWFLFDEVHALHALPAIEHGLQSARNFGGAFVLGIHSFDKLVATYGLQNATALAGLARTKLILATADRTTAEKCSEFIGDREVRQMDEAYSFGPNETRDASTITPRTGIEPLVIPDDIANLPSLHGFVKFPDGFPAARVVLQYRNYAEIAPGFCVRTDFEPTEYVPPEDRGHDAKRAGGEGETGEGGREHTPDRPVGGEERDGEKGKDQHTSAPASKLSDAEKAAQGMEVIDQQNRVAADVSSTQATAVAAGVVAALAVIDPSQPGAPRPAGLDANLAQLTSPRIGDRGQIWQNESARDRRATSENQRSLERGGKDNVEDQIIREARDGFGTEPDHHGRIHNDVPETEIDDDFGMGG